MHFYDRCFTNNYCKLGKNQCSYRGQVHIQREILLEQRASERAHRRVVGEVEVHLQLAI